METLRVLVTDDELGMRLGVERTLRRFTVHVPDVDADVNFTVEMAETGEQALEIIAHRPPDILMLDYKMPGFSGLEVLDRLQAMQDEMLTIMITAYASIETAVAATKRGAYDFLTKPFTPIELKDSIRKAASRLILARQARKLAEEKRQVRFQFIRVLGHELKAPLNAIDGYLKLIASRTLGDDLATYDDMIQRSQLRIDGMRKLIADLLDMTRIESGQKDRSLEPIDIVAVARQAIETEQPAAREREVTIHLDAEDSIVMQADRVELEMIFNNLLSNAVKYNRQGGRVDVKIRRRDGLITIGVADTGIGMTPEEASKLFGEFVRIRNTKTRNILGSGLGLSILKRLAYLYGGDVEVDSQPDVGSTFRVTLKETPEAKAIPAEDRISISEGE